MGTGNTLSKGALWSPSQGATGESPPGLTAEDIGKRSKAAAVAKYAGE